MAVLNYEPLSSKPGSFRLLSLQPAADPTAPIECQLSNADFITNPSTYEALSYTWGDANSTLPITVNSIPFAATSNLHAALLALRRPTQARTLWIDAICIDQSNLKEQGSQVRAMWEIYHAAVCVVVWLGVASHDSGVAMGNIARREAQTRLPMRNDWDRERPEGDEGCRCAAGRWETYPPRVGVQQLAGRKWFSRVWVLQEVAAARRVVVMCGDDVVDGDDFRREMVMSAEFNRNFQRLIPQIRPALELMDGRKRAVEKTRVFSRPLLELVESFRTWDATKAVDKVYALLRLSSDAADAADIQPDYNITPAELARKLIRFSFPSAGISPPFPGVENVEFEIEGLNLGTLSQWTRNSETFYSIKADSEVAGSTFSPAAKTFLGDRWDIRISSERKVPHESSLVLLRGATRPTIISHTNSNYKVSFIATPEPIKDGMSLVIQSSNQAPPSFRGRGWDEALESLKTETENWTSFKLSWSPFEPLDSFEVERFVPKPNTFETQFDALLESIKDLAEGGLNEHHDCSTVTMFWALFHHHEAEIKAGTWPNLMTIPKAAYNGLAGTIRLLLDANADVDVRGSELRETGLHLAAERGHVKAVNALIEGGATIDVLDAFNKTPLSYAANEGQAEVCKILLAAHANPNPTGQQPNRLFFGAVMKGYTDVVSAFLDAKSEDLNAGIEGKGNGPTALHVAAETGNVDITRLLLEAGASASPRIMTKATPLHQAAIYGHTAVIELLLGKGAEMDAQDFEEMTPLDCALYCGQTGASEVLRQAGAKQHAVVNRDTLSNDEGDCATGADMAVERAAKEGDEEAQEEKTEEDDTQETNPDAVQLEQLKGLTIQDILRLQQMQIQMEAMSTNGKNAVRARLSAASETWVLRPKPST